MTDFLPGDVVICVDDATHAHPGFVAIPPQVVKGRAYTVDRWVPVRLKSGRNPVLLGLPAEGVLLRESDTIVIGWHGEPMGYFAERFRRVYRPDGNFISQCLKPVDLGTEVEA